MDSLSLPLTEVIQTSYAYSTWANDVVLDAAELLAPEEFTVERVGGGRGSIRDTLVHMLDTERWWIGRCAGLEDFAEPDPSDFPDVASIRDRWAAVTAETQAHLVTLDDAKLGEDIRFDTKDGGSHSRVHWQILMHQLDHATQHRGAISYTLTELGQSPGDFDFMDFVERYGNTAD